MLPSNVETVPVKISGKLNIRQADTLHDELATSIETQPAVIIDLAEVTDCDAIGLQLLWSAKRYAERLGKPFSVAGATAALHQSCAQLGLRFSDLSSSPSEGL
jgi:anti-anti-sigma regulatory factor